MDVHVTLTMVALITTLIIRAHAQTRPTPAPSIGEVLRPLCGPDAEIPHDLIQCGSCNNRCGTKMNPADLESTRPGALCSCDKFCGFYGDCCQDIRTYCPKDYLGFQEASGQYPFAGTHDDFQCKSFGTSLRNLVIHTCPDGSECEFTSVLNEDVNTFVPMYGIHRGVHYISGQCAVCNAARDVRPWHITLNCKPIEGNITETGVIDSKESLNDVITSGACAIEYSVPDDPRPCYLGDIISTCPSSCENRNLVQLCEYGLQSLTTLGWNVYRNVHCAVCNAQTRDTTDSLACGLLIGNLGPQGFPESETADRDFNPGSFSLTLVFDFDPRDGLTIGEHPPPGCRTGEVYVPKEDRCRPITCPSGFVLDGSDCIPEPSNITAVVTGTFSVEPTVQMIDTLYQDQTHLETNIKNNAGKILDAFNVTYNELVLITKFHKKNNSLTTEVTIACNCNFQSLQQEDESVVKKFEHAYSDLVRREVIHYIFGRNLVLTSITFYIDFQLNNVTVLNLTEHSDCIWLAYAHNDIQSGNGTITVISTGRTYTSGKYEVLDGTVIVCETDFTITKDLDDTDLALSIITCICVGISIICLIIRIIMQFRITSFKNRPGKLQIQLTLAFLLAFIVLIVGPFLSKIPDACTTAAILMAYGFLAAFIWMNVIAVDTWLVFRPSSAFSHSDEKQQSLTVHCIVGWGIPLLVVTPSIAMNYVDTEHEYWKPEFGGPRCWYTQRYAMLVYFGVPIAVSILVNMCLYIVTCMNLFQAFKDATNVIKAEGYHFGIYVRLFILMGITWIFGFISAFTDEIVVDFIFVILTSLQGLFLFISFVCNKRTMSDIRRRRSSESSSSSQRRTKIIRVPSHDSSLKNDSKI